MNRPGRTAFAWRQSIRPVMPTGALLLEYSLGSMAGGSLSFCKFCGGCGSDNRNFVQPAIQAPRGVQMHIKEAGR